MTQTYIKVSTKLHYPLSPLLSPLQDTAGV